MDLFNREDLEALIKEFATRLDGAGIHGSISIVGGAALALTYIPDRHATTDIDALFPKNPTVEAIISEIAEEKSLPPDWINQKVNMFMPFEAIELWDFHSQVGNIKIQIGKADLLLAMKLKANRGLRDNEDIESLLKICDLKSIAEVEEIYEKYEPQGVINADAREIVVRMLENM